MPVEYLELQIPEYSFLKDKNPYHYASSGFKSLSLKMISEKIFAAIRDNESSQKKLIRGIQSGKHKKSKEKLITEIFKNGKDFENTKERNTIFALPLENEKTVLNILQGFHSFKPKCDEVPQLRVDIWLIFDLSKYRNINYLHPRHKVFANDKWERINKSEAGLLEIINLVD